MNSHATDEWTSGPATKGLPCQRRLDSLFFTEWVGLLAPSWLQIQRQTDSRTGDEATSGKWNTEIWQPETELYLHICLFLTKRNDNEKMLDHRFTSSIRTCIHFSFRVCWVFFSVKPFAAPKQDCPADLPSCSFSFTQSIIVESNTSAWHLHNFQFLKHLRIRLTQSTNTSFDICRHQHIHNTYVKTSRPAVACRCYCLHPLFLLHIHRISDCFYCYDQMARVYAQSLYICIRITTTGWFLSIVTWFNPSLKNLFFYSSILLIDTLRCPLFQIIVWKSQILVWWMEQNN